MLKSILLAFGLALAVANTCNALPSDSSQIVVVNMQRIIDESIIGKAARNNVDVEAKKSKGKLEAMKIEFAKAKAEVDKQAALLSGSALEERRQGLEKKQREFERSAQDLQESLMKKNDSQISKVVKEIDAVVKDLADSHDYKFVFERDERFIVYTDNRLDLTDEVIKTLDKKKVAL